MLIPMLGKYTGLIYLEEYHIFYNRFVCTQNVIYLFIIGLYFMNTEHCHFVLP